MFKHQDIITQLNKILLNSEVSFIKQLHYWTSRSKYGIGIQGKTWIYNTLEQWAEQLKVSKITVRRTVASLKSKNLIETAYLSPNRRNRTLYYAINYDKIEQFVNDYSTELCLVNYSLKIKQEEQSYVITYDHNTIQNKHLNEHINEHMGEHMYIDNNKQKQINKSSKSDKSKKNISNTNEHIGITIQKPTIVQDMLQIWNEEFQKTPTVLTKQLARFLVSAFKTKFDSCLKKWKIYLKTLKTSTFIMSNKFKLSIEWAIKFLTIDRIKNGWLGADESKIPVDAAEIQEQTVKHIEQVQESPKCKILRRKIAEKFSSAVYMAWFTKIQMRDEENGIAIEAPNKFVKDYVTANFLYYFETDIQGVVIAK